MKERPVIFTAREVLATLDGRMTLFMREVQPRVGGLAGLEFRSIVDGIARFYDPETKIYPQHVSSPYGMPGDRLYVRESWDDMHGRLMYRASEPQMISPGGCGSCLWKSPVTMPRRYSRIALEVGEVRVLRVQEIGAVDAMLSGVDFDDAAAAQKGNGAGYLVPFLGPWNPENPWVWVVSFTVAEETEPQGRPS